MAVNTTALDKERRREAFHAALDDGRLIIEFIIKIYAGNFLSKDCNYSD